MTVPIFTEFGGNAMNMATEIETLRKALAPFARYGNIYPHWADQEEIKVIEHRDRKAVITVGDFRAAGTAMRCHDE